MSVPKTEPNHGQPHNSQGNSVSAGSSTSQGHQRLSDSRNYDKRPAVKRKRPQHPHNQNQPRQQPNNRSQNFQNRQNQDNRQNQRQSQDRSDQIRNQNCDQNKNQAKPHNPQHRFSDGGLHPPKRRKQDLKPGQLHPAEVLNTVVEIDQPFEYKAQVGQGTYGKVYKAEDRVSRKLLAMKRLRMGSQNEGFPVTAAREIQLLQVLKHENIVKLSEIVVSRGEIYMALDYIEHDLAGLLRHPDLVIRPQHIKSIIKQTLSALSFLHSRNILHRDIKSSNLLVTADGTIKLADFGLARNVSGSLLGMRLTNRVITLWYRPPELLLGSENYGPEVDVWGAGCLFVELFTKTALFQGKDEVAQLESIFSVMGKPDATWPEYSKLPWFHLINALPPSGSISAYRFNRVFAGEGITGTCFNLASSLLEMNPKRRISAKMALSHPYFVQAPEPEKLALKMEHEWHEWEVKKREKPETVLNGQSQYDPTK